MSKFDFLKSNAIKELELYEKREAILENFLFERSINIIWGRAGLGKTWLCFAISKALVAKGYEVVYLDNDNGIDMLKDRGYDKHIATMGKNFTYLNGDMMDDSKNEMIDVMTKIEKNISIGYEKAVFLFDSLTFFLGSGLYDEAKIERFVVFCKKIRKAGGSVLVINHSTKNGDVMRGGGTITNSFDEVWEAQKGVTEKDRLHFVLTPTKKRMNVKEVAYSICTKNLLLEPLDALIANIDDNEALLIDEIKNILKKQALTQGELMSALKKDRADKTVLNLLNKFENRFWESQKIGKNRVYKAL